MAESRKDLRARIQQAMTELRAAGIPEDKIEAAIRARLAKRQAQLPEIPRDIYDFVNEEATKLGISPNLVFAMMERESDFVPTKIGEAGERGLLQVLPSTGKALGFNLSDPREATLAGMTYLSQQLGRFSDVEKALAAYNGGPDDGELGASQDQKPNIRAYSSSVSARFRQLEGAAAAGIGPIFSNNAGFTEATTEFRQPPPGVPQPIPGTPTGTIQGGDFFEGGQLDGGAGRTFGDPVRDPFSIANMLKRGVAGAAAPFGETTEDQLILGRMATGGPLTEDEKNLRDFRLQQQGLPTTEEPVSLFGNLLGNFLLSALAPDPGTKFGAQARLGVLAQGLGGYGTLVDVTGRSMREADAAVGHTVENFIRQNVAGGKSLEDAESLLGAVGLGLTDLAAGVIGDLSRPSSWALLIAGGWMYNQSRIGKFGEMLQRKVNTALGSRTGLSTTLNFLLDRAIMKPIRDAVFVMPIAVREAIAVDDPEHAAETFWNTTLAVAAFGAIIHLGFGGIKGGLHLPAFAKYRKELGKQLSSINEILVTDFGATGARIRKGPQQTATDLPRINEMIQSRSVEMVTRGKWTENEAQILTNLQVLKYKLLQTKVYQIARDSFNKALTPEEQQIAAKAALKSFIDYAQENPATAEAVKRVVPIMGKLIDDMVQKVKASGGDVPPMLDSTSTALRNDPLGILARSEATGEAAALSGRTVGAEANIGRVTRPDPARPGLRETMTESEILNKDKLAKQLNLEHTPTTFEQTSGQQQFVFNFKRALFEPVSKAIGRARTEGEIRAQNLKAIVTSATDAPNDLTLVDNATDQTRRLGQMLEQLLQARSALLTEGEGQATAATGSILKSIERLTAQIVKGLPDDMRPKLLNGEVGIATPNGFLIRFPRGPIGQPYADKAGLRVHPGAGKPLTQARVTVPPPRKVEIFTPVKEAVPARETANLIEIVNRSQQRQFINERQATTLIDSIVRGELPTADAVAEAIKYQATGKADRILAIGSRQRLVSRINNARLTPDERTNLIGRVTRGEIREPKTLNAVIRELNKRARSKTRKIAKQRTGDIERQAGRAARRREFETQELGIEPTSERPTLDILESQKPTRSVGPVRPRGRKEPLADLPERTPGPVTKKESAQATKAADKLATRLEKIADGLEVATTGKKVTSLINSKVEAILIALKDAKELGLVTTQEAGGLRDALRKSDNTEAIEAVGQGLLRLLREVSTRPAPSVPTGPLTTEVTSVARLKEAARRGEIAGISEGGVSASEIFKRRLAKEKAPLAGVKGEE